ncbi:MAG: hypothetical protein IPP91_12815 [Betaproteobacteria bacterium]|nr:hypothetical protein [Betaproteobacteria bacterium]
MATDSPGVSTPIRAGLFIRLVYSVALLAFLLSALVGASGWISLAIGGGVAGGTGLTGFLIIAALVLFRNYQVLRYPAALDARPPTAFGTFLRNAGVLAMLAGAASGVGLFLVKPITLLVFRSAGDAGIGYFVVGLALVVLANLGWLGCLAFELSRACGKPLPPEMESPPWWKRRQDVAVLGVLVVAAIGAPPLLRQGAGKQCRDNDLANCESPMKKDLQFFGDPSHPQAPGQPSQTAVFEVLETKVHEPELIIKGDDWSSVSWDKEGYAKCRSLLKSADDRGRPELRGWQLFVNDPKGTRKAREFGALFCNAEALWFVDYAQVPGHVILTKFTIAGEFVYRLKFEKPREPGPYDGHFMNPTFRAEDGYLYFEWWNTNQSGSDRHVKSSMKARVREPLPVVPAAPPGGQP